MSNAPGGQIVPGTLSPDRAWVWTGGGWVHASEAQYSADRAYIWNGTQWLPNAGAGAPTPSAPYPIPSAAAPNAAGGVPQTTRISHAARNVAIVIGALVVAAVIIGNAAKGPTSTVGTNTSAVVSVAPTPTLSPKPSPTPKPSPSLVAKGPSCTPQPCASAFSLTVRISGLNRNAPVGFIQPEAGNHLVLMQMTVHNDGGQDTKTINPFDFKLRDAAGVSHDVTFSDAPGCDIWSSVDLAPGATYGPKPLCFEASGAPSGALTLLWTPDVFGPTQEIHL